MAGLSVSALASKIAKCEEATGFIRDVRDQRAFARDLRKLRPSTLRWLAELVDERTRLRKRVDDAQSLLKGIGRVTRR